MIRKDLANSVKTFVTGNGGVSNTNRAVTRSLGTGAMRSWIQSIIGVPLAVPLVLINLTE